MKHRPILFSGSMVQAILRADNPKTQTRRVVKPSQSTPKITPLMMEPWLIDGEQETDDNGVPCWVGYHHEYPTGEKWFSCPYGKVGDTLWVRETWLPDPPDDESWDNHAMTYVEWSGCDTPIKGIPASLQSPNHCLYRAGWDGGDLQWRPSIFMPRWASRIRLRLTDVRVEQLQDISDYDCSCEGIVLTTEDGENYRDDFQLLWDGINGKKYPWDSNPWVWALSFERIT